MFLPDMRDEKVGDLERPIKASRAGRDNIKYNRCKVKVRHLLRATMLCTPSRRISPNYYDPYYYDSMLFCMI